MERLRELRLAHELTQKQVAEQLNISTRAYAHYEQGGREPSLDVLRKICDFFDVSADYLIGRTDEY